MNQAQTASTHESVDEKLLWDRNRLRATAMTYRHPMTIHEGEFFGFLGQPPFWAELVDVGTKNEWIAMLNPAIDSNNGLVIFD